MTIFQRWIYALKLDSWSKVLVPFFIGQALGVHTTGQFLWEAFLIGLGFTVFGVIFIVLMNDWRDIRVDKIKREMFPDGCSPKTIPDNILSADALFIGAMLSGFVALSFALLGVYILGLVDLWWRGLLCAAVFIIYTLPPIQLNYRGGGELLEMIGIALALPLFSAYLQVGNWEILGVLQVLIPYLLLALSSAVASGLSDEESDKKGGKTTFVTIFGNELARFFILILGICAIILSLFINALFPIYSYWITIATNIIIGFYLYKMMQYHNLALTNAFKAQKVYKQYLHYAIWRSIKFIGLIIFVIYFWK